MRSKEYSIMDNNLPYWVNERQEGLERHEIFEGRTENRDKSIEDGLVIFTTPEVHRTSKDSIHLNPKKWIWLKEEAEKRWIEYYGKSVEDFIERYGRNYLSNF